MTAQRDNWLREYLEAIKGTGEVNSAKLEDVLKKQASQQKQINRLFHRMNKPECPETCALPRHLEDHHSSFWVANFQSLLYFYRKHIGWMLGTAMTALGVTVAAFWPNIGTMAEKIGKLIPR